MNRQSTNWIDGEQIAPLSATTFSDRMSPIAKTYETSAGPIRYAEIGKGPAILFFHGIPLSMCSWQDLFFDLASDHRVVAIDMPGYGGSGKGFSDLSMDGISGVVSELADHLKLRDITLMGSSFGAAVATSMALNRPDLASRLILINSVGIAGGTHAVEQAARIGLIRNAVKSVLLRRTLGKRVFRSKMKASYAALTPDDDLVTYYYDLLTVPGTAESFLQTLQQFSEKELQQRLPKLDAPVLSIWGGKDKVLPVKKSLGVQSLLRNCWSAIIPEAGHLPHEEFPDRVAQMVRRFLAVPHVNPAQIS